MSGACPPCFTPEQYAIWKSAETSRVTFCTDCLPAFKRRMERAKRCTHPEVRFAMDEDGFLTGLRADVRRKG